MYHNFLNFRKPSIILEISLVLLSTALSAAQTEKIDSLTRQVQVTTNEERVDALYNLSYELIDVDNLRAMEYAKEGYELSVELGDSLRMVQTSRVWGSSLRRLERLDDAISVSERALAIAERNKFGSEIKIYLNSIAIAYSLKAEYDKALEFHYRSLIMREEGGDKAEISITLNNIGFIYFKLRNYDTALEYWERALELRRAANETWELDRLLINLGTCHIHLKNFNKALATINEGLKVCGKNCSDQVRVEAETSLGIAFYNLEQIDDARQHFSTSLEISKRIDYKRFQVENLVYLVKISIREEKFRTAEELLRDAEMISSSTSYNQLLMDIYKQYSTLYVQMRDFEKASVYQEKYILLKDSLVGEELLKNINKIQTTFEERENLKTIASKNETIQRQRSLNIAIVIIAVLAALLVFVLYRSNRVKKKVNQALSDAKAIIEDQNRQLMSSNFMLNNELHDKNAELEKANESLSRVNEELDNFIYKTSHDIRGPLASLKGMCNVALMDVRDELALSYLKKLDITAEKLNTILTRLLIVNQINNSVLGAERIDFNGIVNDVLVLERKKGLPPRLTITKHIDEDISFTSDKEFVRIILENLIDNAIKFYNDSVRIEPFVDIAVSEADNHITIKVIDNGIGISQVHPDKIFQMFSRASERSETGGIGLYITKTAAEKLGGSVNLKTTPEGFTEFYVTLPLVPAKVLA